MTHAVHAPHGFGLTARLAGLRAEWDAWRARRALFRQTYDELAALSDRELADIGLHRTEIGRVAREAAAQI